MGGMMNTLLKHAKTHYVNIAFMCRHIMRWKKINGVALCITDRQISRKVFGNIVWKDYEIDENKILQQTFTAQDRLLELGTGIGFNAIYCARINHGQVVSYEGNSNLVPLIRLNMEKNGVDFDVKNEIVVSKKNHPSTVAFNIVDDFWSSSSKQLPAGIVRTVNVPTVNINEVIHAYQPTYLVMDIEGGEEDLFDDGDWLDQSPIKKILIELHADIIGEEKCFMVMQQIIKKGFTMSFDGAPKNVVYFFR